MKVIDGIQLYTIGELSRVSEIATSRIRYYDRIGLIKPDHIDEESGYRYYEPQKLVPLLAIKYEQRLGFALEEIQDYFMKPSLHKSMMALEERVENLDREMEILRRKQRSAQEWAIALKIGHQALENAARGILPEPKLQVAPELQMITAEGEAVRNDSDFVINSMTVNTAERYDLYLTGACALVFDDYRQRMNHSNPVTRLYVPISKVDDPPKEIMVLPTFRAATLIHLGSYDTIGESYEKLLEWCRIQGLEAEGSSMERLLVDIWSTVDEQELVTEIWLKLK